MAKKAAKLIPQRLRRSSRVRSENVKASPEPRSEFSQPRKRRPFKVFLVMDDCSVRESLAAPLREQGIDVEEYMTAMEFYRDYRQPLPGVLITEISLRGMSGLELMQMLQRDKRELPVALIFGHRDSPQAVKGLATGAVDALVKPVKIHSLMQCITRAYAHVYDVDWEFVDEDIDDIEKGMQLLSTREQKILKLVMSGMSSSELSAKLGNSVKTIEAHRANISSKLRADDLPHLVRMVTAYNNSKSEQQ